MQTPEIATGLRGALEGTPDWRTPFTGEQLQSMQSFSDIETEDYAAKMREALGAELANRGLEGSSLAISGNAGLFNWLQKRKAEERARVGLLGMQRGDALRQEQRGALGSLEQLEQARRAQGQENFYRSLGWLGGGAGPTVAYDPLGTASAYGDVARMYGGLAGSSGAGFGQLLGSMFGGTSGGSQQTPISGTPSSQGWTIQGPSEARFGHW